MKTEGSQTKWATCNIKGKSLSGGEKSVGAN